MTELTHYVHKENAESILKEIEDAFYDIPFENSAFQTEAFVLASQMTPERAYRALGLRMQKKLIAVQEYILDRDRIKIEIDELMETSRDPALKESTRKIAEIDAKKKALNLPFSDKLLNDALAELNVLYKHFKALPRYTRQEFEAGEQRHFLERNIRQANGINGGQESLLNMHRDLQALEKFEHAFACLPETQRELLGSVTEQVLDNLSSHPSNQNKTHSQIEKSGR